MASLFGTPDYRKCLCNCGECTGCCFCPGDPATNVSYVIDAPNCAAMDGVTGNISGPDVGTVTGCGSCVSLPNNSQTHGIPTFVWDDSIPENGCVPQPGAEFQFRFIMKCDENQPSNETDPNTTEACCRNVRLVVTNELNEVLRLIPPLSCSCDPLTGIMAIFDISVLFPDCTTTYPSGVCAGQPTCTQLGDGPGGVCSMSGATLTITQSC